MRLVEWQNAFVDALSEKGFDTPLLSLVNAREIDRLAVYRNNNNQALTAAMRTAYPICDKILGEQCFDQLARNYQVHHPLKQSHLNQYGEFFSELLANTIAVHTEFAGLEYLSDLAQLEWLLQLSYYAGDRRDCYSLSQLGLLSEDQQASVVMLLRPDVKLLRSTYPLYELWLKYQGEQDNIKISAPEDEYHFCIYRNPFKPQVERISSEEYRVLTDIMLSHSLSQMTESGVDMASLNSVITTGWVCGFTGEDITFTVS
ncbi:putative DNA-binding domain-containing protein [Shewanella sp. VB17]|uniref:HvfC/BufC N-terminal domain-containing protein n=1 Tax=Shewanella sp. VB17 TaxID=2739432 RepID=UPI00156625D3|nr:DNA-binding domain-containing protein [Shewanella sp. VB17]NRD71973.1 putative DNA-binding domain-containing protein [Shewanella sp. VB17]